MGRHLLLALVIACLCAHPAPAAEPLRYLREYVPADRVAEWPVGGTTYRPTDPAEFERLVRQLSASNAERQAAHITSAEYEARLVGDDLAQGRARLKIEHRGPPALMALAPCDLAILSARWTERQDLPQPAPELRTIARGGEAVLGLDSAGRTAVLVAGSGVLELEWEVRGRRETAELWATELALPKALSTTLLLDLPAGLVPSSVAGVITGPTAVPAPPPAPGETRPDSSKLRRWRIDLGGRHQLSLRVAPGDGVERTNAQTLVRQTSTYDFSLRGMQILTALELEAIQQPLRRVEVTLDPGLELLAARLDEAPLEWSTLPQETKAGPPKKNAAPKPQRVVFELPTPIQGARRVLRLEGWAPLVLDKVTRLPTLRTPGLAWQQGRATLRVPAPLVIERLEPVRIGGAPCGRQVETSPLAPPASGESLTVEFYSEPAALDLEIGRRRQELKSASGTTLDWSLDEITATTSIDLDLSQDKLFEFEADVPAAWTLDSVTTEPFEALADWNRQSSGGAIDRLKIRLGQALSRGRGVRLTVTGRLLRPPLGEAIRLSDLEPVQVRGAAQRERMLAVRTSGPYRLELRDADRVAQSQANELDVSRLARLSGPSFDLLLTLPNGPSAASLALVEELPRYKAEVALEASVGAGPLVEAVTIRCLPQGARELERILLYLPDASPPAAPDAKAAERDGSEPDFGLADATLPRSLAARRLATDAAESLGLSGGELWELKLRTPRSEPFEIIVRRARPWGERVRASLPRLPEASGLSGTLVVRSAGNVDVDVESHGLKPVALPLRAGLLAGIPRAAFRTVAVAGSALAAGDVVLTRRQSERELPAALVWQSQLESRFDPRGAARHVATFRVQNVQASELVIDLPSGARLAGLWVDRQALSSRGVAGTLRAPLPEGQRFSTVRVEYEMQAGSLRWYEHLQCEAPEVNVPVLDRQVIVWLPPGYTAVGAGPRSQTSQTWRTLSIHEPSVTERLLGPFGRRDAARPFDPLLASQWQALAPGFEPAASWAVAIEQAAAAGFTAGRWPLGESWAHVLAFGMARATSERTLLQPAGVAVTPPELMIDVRALAQAGLHAHTSVLAEDIEQLFAESGLAWLVHGNALALTTQAAAVDSGATPTSAPRVYRAGTNGGAHALETALATAGGADDAGFVPLAQWAAAQDPPWPRDLSSLTTADPGAASAWNAYRFEGGTGPVELVVVHAASWQALTWGAFLAAFAVGWMLGRRCARLLLLLALAAAAALVVPPDFVPFCSATVLGLLAALAAGWLGSAWQRTVEPSPSTLLRAQSSLHTVAGPVTAATLTLIALTAVWQAATLAYGQAAPAAAPVIYRVLIPVDDQGQLAAGAQYQVPVGLYRELLARAEAQAGRPRGWLLGAARYRTGLARDAGGAGFTVSQVAASYALQAFEAAPVELPFVQSEVDIPLDQITLDGRPAVATWNAAGRLAIQIPEPGAARLELVLKPKVKSSEGSSGFEFAVPSVPQARLEVAFPPQPPAVETLGARGCTELDELAHQLRVELGPAESLAVRWREDDPSSGSPQLEVDKLISMKVLPSSTQLDVKLRYRVLHGAVRRVYIEGDPRLTRLKDWQAPNLRDWQRRDLPGHPRTYVLNFAKPMTGQFDVEASFSIEGAGAQRRLPRLEPLWSEAGRRWLAVSIDPHLAVVSSAGTETPASEFLAAWGADLRPKPIAVFNLASGAKPGEWSLTTRPKEAAKTVRQTLRLAVGRERADVRFDATIVTSDAPAFQHQLSVPSELAIERVQVFEEATDRAARWQRDGDQLTVFLDAPAGEQQLALVGSMPLKVPGPLVIPHIRLNDAALQGARVQLHRRAEVLVDAPHALPPEEQLRSDSGRLLADFEEPTEGTLEPLGIRLNKAELRLDQALSLLRKDVRWQAQLEVRVREVTGGVADALRFDIPVHWSGPFTVSPDMPYEVVDAPGDGQRRLALYPRGAIAGPFHVTVRGPLTVASDARAAAPRISAHARHKEQFLVLPLQVEQQNVDWDIQGLTPAELPHDFTAPEGESQIVRQLEPGARASLERVDVAGPAAQVRLADYTLAASEGGSYWGVAAFDIEPANRPQCVLIVPAPCRPLLFTVAGVPVEAAPLGDGKWRLPLGAAEFPQRVEVVFLYPLVTRAASEGNHWMFQAPHIEGLPVERTLWAVHGLGKGARLVSSAAAGRDIRELELERVRSLTALVDETATRLSEEPVEELREWYAAWASRLRNAAEDVRQIVLLRDSPTPTTEEERSAPAQLQKLAGQQQYWVQLLGGPAPESDAATTYAAQLARVTLARQSPAPAVGAYGSAETLVVSAGPAPEERRLSRYLAAAGLVLIALFFSFGRGRRAFAGWFARWSHGALAAGGFAWWLWLAPSWLGLAIVGVALWAALRGRLLGAVEDSAQGIVRQRMASRS